MTADPKKAARAALYVARKTGADDDHAPMHTPHHPAVAELKHLLTTHRDELRRMKGKTQYAAIDAIMKRISREHGIAPRKLHDDWMSVYHQTPDAWVAGDHGNVVDHALKMTSRGGYAFGGAAARAALHVTRRMYAEGGDVNDFSRQLTPQGLYSHAAATAMSLPQVKGSPQQMMAMLTSRGVKPEEMHWSGAPNAFQNQKSITRDQLAQQFHQGLPKIHETILSDQNGIPTKYEEHQIPGVNGVLDNNKINNWLENYAKESAVESGDIDHERDWDDAEQHVKDWHFDIAKNKFDEKKFNDNTFKEQFMSDKQNKNNYKELIFHMPSVKQKINYGHWDQPNVIGHIRMSDRDNGKTLHLEELQSDWGQQARKLGVSKPYKSNDIELISPENIKDERRKKNFWNFNTPTNMTSLPKDLYPNVEDAIRHLTTSPVSPGVQPAPYISSTHGWTDFLLKRALHEAANGGYDRITWTPGKIQAKRWNNEGLIPYYDQIVPNRLQEVTKQIGHKAVIEPHNIDAVDEQMALPSIRITPELRRRILEGMPAYASGGVVDRALAMTRRGGFAGGGAPAGFAAATGAPINFAPAAGAFTGLPSPESLNLAPSKATMAAILASHPTTHTGSGKPVELSRYTPPAIAAPTFNASLYNPPDNPLEEDQGGGYGSIGAYGGGGNGAGGGGGAGGIGGGGPSARGGRIHRADGGEAYNQLPEAATASMPSKRQAPFGVTPPQGAVPTPMSQATRNLTDPGQVTIKSMSDAFNNAISNHLSLSPGEKITNARQAAQNISEFLGSSKTGKMNALLTANGKLMKAAKSQSGKEPVTIPDGRGVETLGLSLFPDFKEGQFRVCGNSDSCRDSCIGKKSNAYSMDPTQAADQIPLTKQDREGMSGKPRMSALTRTHALMRDPESFAVYLHDLIDHEKIAAARRGNLLGVRLNTLSDIPPSVFAPIIKAHPDVAFYDYTKMNYDPIAPNHHYTYSSTGVSQPEIGIENPFQNWHKSRDRLNQGENVAMAFSHKSGEAFPRMIHDEETGRHYKVVSGDEHDFRPLDIQDEGKAGVIVALKNIAKDLGHETAAQKSNGFFVRHDPGFVKDKKGNFVKDENGDRIPQNLIYTIRAQQKKRSPLTVFRRSGENV